MRSGPCRLGNRPTRRSRGTSAMISALLLVPGGCRRDAGRCPPAYACVSRPALQIALLSTVFTGLRPPGSGDRRFPPGSQVCLPHRCDRPGANRLRVRLGRRFESPFVSGRATQGRLSASDATGWRLSFTEAERTAPPRFFLTCMSYRKWPRQAGRLTVRSSQGALLTAAGRCRPCPLCPCGVCQASPQPGEAPQQTPESRVLRALSGLPESPVQAGEACRPDARLAGVPSPYRLRGWRR